ncbi:MAG: histidine phosphatase family protein [Flavobacteriaceae bacterium]|nr:histidine phosphatase family protein [Flavobacteriaceae bacterium]|tara:strand:+ start:5220 stop:5705 length:486 start_codon:yes stop_codon:yes gene_type:complete
MKELVLLRHAKSSWDNNLEDRNRPLMEKGVNRIINISKVSKKIFLNTDIIYSSPAIRALSTAIIMASTLNIDFLKINIKEDLYSFDYINIINFIRSIDNKFNRVICVGHNPAFTQVANFLGENELNNLPTAGWIKLKFNESIWKNVNKGKSVVGLPKNILK